MECKRLIDSGMLNTSLYTEQNLLDKTKKILLTFPEDQWCIIYTISATTYKQFTKLHGKYDRESDRTSKCNGSQANKPKQDLLLTYELLTKDA